MNLFKQIVFVALIAIHRSIMLSAMEPQMPKTESAKDANPKKSVMIFLDSPEDYQNASAHIDNFIAETAANRQKNQTSIARALCASATGFALVGICSFFIMANLDQMKLIIDRLSPVCNSFSSECAYSIIKACAPLSALIGGSILIFAAGRGFADASINSLLKASENCASIHKAETTFE